MSDFSEASYGLFAKVNEGKFKRALSNLINNSVEAIESTGEVIVTLETKNGLISLQVRDTGS